MTDERISVQSVTGVDLSLPLAGPGTRSYAFLIDWHVRVLLVAAWLMIAVFAFQLGLNPRSHDALFSTLPALVIYFLYQPIVELAFRGRSPGKRIAGVRILDRRGGVPSLTALVIRNLFRLIDSLPAFYVVGLTTCFLTANRVRIGDMAAGTLLVLDDSAAGRSLARVESLAASSALPLETLELVDQLLERWTSLEADHRAEIARKLLARVGAAAGPSEVAGLSDAELQGRLRALLGDRTGVVLHA
jgi:uncharacterized RDD family membrane protein YckC